jgi:pyruvate formate lyase activating enzyme
METQTGIVFDIYRGTTHDGPGMRTTVFFKGCPLSCEWCHNPEGIKPGREIWWDSAKCIGCMLCRDACSKNAISADDNSIQINPESCVRCGNCVKVCPARAMVFAGDFWTAEELVKEVLKDKSYFESFGGGVTVSGGEPLNQYVFVRDFFRTLKAEGIHTALDTCGLAPGKAFDAILPFTDCVLYDLKIFSAELHRKFTGQSNKLILANLVYVANYIRKIKKNIKLWIRTPLIPEATADKENIISIARFIKENLDDVLGRWELCAFNNVCKSKYQKINKPWSYENNGLTSQKEVDKLTSAVLVEGIAQEYLVVSGLISKD